jgi:hypothetical protein
MLAVSNIFNTRIRVNMAHSEKRVILLLNFIEGLGHVTIYHYTINEKINWVLVLPQGWQCMLHLFKKSDHFEEHQMI